MLTCHNSSIGTSDDEVGRMLEVLRFWFTKDLVNNSLGLTYTTPH
jgi:hypothetical protein